jgi:RNA methyltransferase, TrmH family
MLSKAKISLIRSLEEKKFRQKEGLFVVEGEKMLLELAQSGWEWEQVYLTSTFLERHPNVFGRYEEVQEEELGKISFLKTSTAGLALVKQPKNNEINLKKDGFYVVLDGIRDPGNLGTIVRTLDWFGISEVICSMDTVDFTNPKVIQASMGSIFRVGLLYMDLKVLFEQNSGILPIIGTAMEGENVFQSDLKSGLLIIGNEAEGIRSETQKWVDKWISIPQAGDKVESLNASIATAILCAERYRQTQ